jgi:hypothetical protein
MAQQVENLDGILGQMSQQHETLGSILERALADPDLLQRLADDPLDTLRTAGVGCNFDSIKNWLGIQGASDAELVQMIYNRLKPRCCGGGVVPGEPAVPYQ